MNFTDLPLAIRREVIARQLPLRDLTSLMKTSKHTLGQAPTDPSDVTSIYRVPTTDNDSDVTTYICDSQYKTKNLSFC